MDKILVLIPVGKTLMLADKTLVLLLVNGTPTIYY